MSQVIRHLKGKVRPASEPRPAVVHIEHMRSRVGRSLVHPYFARRIARAARPNVDAPKRWHRHTLARIGFYLTALGTAILLFRLGLAVYGVAWGKPTAVENYCTQTKGACDALFDFFTPFLVLALATFIFMTWRLWWVTRPILTKARTGARELVPTAGAIFEKIVGRDELCTVIMQILHDRDNRRPYLIVGGVGTGKTAVLVRLTELLGPWHAVPVPIRLREVNGQFSFAELAERKFCEEASSGMFPVAFAGRVWQQLRKDDRVVVLADGLEEAFAGSENERDRDNLIRQAIQQAYEQKLPLVIASRPHHPLEATQAAVLELESLSEEAALDYIEDRGPAHDEHRLDWIVETADVTDAPLYLQITRQLYDQGLLEHLTGGPGGPRLDTRGVDRSALRWRILETWLTALITGHLHPEVAIRGRDRRNAITYISALACVGLLMDKIEVSFEDLAGTISKAHAPRTDESLLPEDRQQRERSPYPAVWTALTKEVSDLQPDVTAPGLLQNARPHHRMSLLSLAATHGEQLGLVEMKGAGVRFQHSIIQAYLGSRFIHALHRGELDTALEEPGRELLIALVLDSRRWMSDAGDTPVSGVAAHARFRTPIQLGKGSRHDDESDPRMRVAALLEAAQEHRDGKAFDLYAAALEIDSVLTSPRHAEIAKSLERHWCEVTIGDRRTLEEAKLGAVYRFGEALREIARRNSAKPAYEEFFHIGCQEDSYPIRIAIAQEIGAGGDHAFAALCNGHEDPWDRYQAAEAELRDHEETRAAEYEKEYQKLRKIRGQETAAERVSREEQTRKIHEEATEKRLIGRMKVWHEFVMRAWLAPMLLGSVGDEYRDRAQDYLDKWLKHVRQQPSENHDAMMPISLEIALAQGFKSASNRRRRHPSTSAEARSLLVERTEQILQDSRFWYSHLTLIHALCLWSLPDQPAPDASHPADEQRRHPSPDSSGTDGRHVQVRPSMSPIETVAHWLSIAGSTHVPADHPVNDVSGAKEPEHPFVVEAADLTALALQSGHPERFIWIDESGVMNKVGSRAARPTDYRKHNLWIPPSAGWSALDRRAQLLLADVLIMLNLTEGQGEPEAREQRLNRANRSDLPLCLTKDRRPLEPETTVGMPGMSEPESTCLDGCPFELCPYPPSGALARAELSEAFCRRQQTLLGHRFPRPTRKTAPWQGITPRELRRFWEKMASRTRPHDLTPP